VAFISHDEFEFLAGFIYRKTGIRYEFKKLYFLSKRVQKRMEELGLETTDDYIRKLRFADPEHQEFQLLLNLLTINETYFFRDFPQLQAFAENCLPEVTEKKEAAGKRNLRIWSAGCASGEEPYTIAIILLEMLENPEQWKIDIVASDIDLNMLEKAKKAVYDERSIRDVPEEYLEHYFTVSGNQYRLNSNIRRMVRLEHLNLGERESVRQKSAFDIIFCRNVLIYFDDISRKQLVDQFYVTLNPGGYIFLGSSESVGRISSAFKLKRTGNYLVYYKEEEAEL
jgi:chemotaxis protein methyltransferase CheR